MTVWFTCIAAVSKTKFGAPASFTILLEMVEGSGDC